MSLSCAWTKRLSLLSRTPVAVRCRPASRCPQCGLRADTGASGNITGLDSTVLASRADPGSRRRFRPVRRSGPGVVRPMGVTSGLREGTSLLDGLRFNEDGVAGDRQSFPLRAAHRLASRLAAQTVVRVRSAAPGIGLVLYPESERAASSVSGVLLRPGRSVLGSRHGGRRFG